MSPTQQITDNVVKLCIGSNVSVSYFETIIGQGELQWKKHIEQGKGEEMTYAVPIHGDVGILFKPHDIESVSVTINLKKPQT